jgi:hypothetical protein
MHMLPIRIGSCEFTTGLNLNHTRLVAGAGVTSVTVCSQALQVALSWFAGAASGAAPTVST